MASRTELSVPFLNQGSSLSHGPGVAALLHTLRPSRCPFRSMQLRYMSIDCSVEMQRWGDGQSEPYS